MSMSIIDKPPQFVNPEYEPEEPVALVARTYTPSICGPSAIFANA